MIEPKHVRNSEARLSRSLSPSVSPRTLTTDAELGKLQHASFNYFLHGQIHSTDW